MLNNHKRTFSTPLNLDWKGNWSLLFCVCLIFLFIFLLHNNGVINIVNVANCVDNDNKHLYNICDKIAKDYINIIKRSMKSFDILSNFNRSQGIANNNHNVYTLSDVVKSLNFSKYYTMELRNIVKRSMECFIINEIVDKPTTTTINTLTDISNTATINTLIDTQTTSTPNTLNDTQTTSTTNTMTNTQKIDPLVEIVKRSMEYCNYDPLVEIVKNSMEYYDHDEDGQQDSTSNNASTSNASTSNASTSNASTSNASTSNASTSNKRKVTFRNPVEEVKYFTHDNNQTFEERQELMKTLFDSFF